MIELTTQEARTGDALKAKGQIIQTIQGWKEAVTNNDWLLDEWDDEFASFMKELVEHVKPMGGPSNIIKPK